MRKERENVDNNLQLVELLLSDHRRCKIQKNWPWRRLRFEPPTVKYRREHCACRCIMRTLRSERKWREPCWFPARLSLSCAKRVTNQSASPIDSFPLPPSTMWNHFECVLLVLIFYLRWAWAPCQKEWVRRVWERFRGHPAASYPP